MRRFVEAREVTDDDIPIGHTTLPVEVTTVTTDNPHQHHSSATSSNDVVSKGSPAKQSQHPTPQVHGSSGTSQLSKRKADPRKQRPMNEQLKVGTRVSVHWPAVKCDFEGTVADTIEELGNKQQLNLEFRVDYDDGEVKWHKLQNTTVKVLPPVAVTRSAAAPVPPVATPPRAESSKACSLQNRSAAAPVPRVTASPRAKSSKACSLQDQLCKKGTRVGVYWPAEERYYEGAVSDAMEELGDKQQINFIFEVHYDDNEVHWHALHDTDVKLLLPAAASPHGAPLKLHLSKRNMTGYRGVCECFRTPGRFEARHKNTFIGTFASAVEAAKAFAKHMAAIGQLSENEADEDGGNAGEEDGERDTSFVEEAEGWRLHLSETSSTGYLGVKFVAAVQGDRYRASLSRLGSLGTYSSAVEAALAIAKAIGKDGEAEEDAEDEEDGEEEDDGEEDDDDEEEDNEDADDDQQESLPSRYAGFDLHKSTKSNAGYLGVHRKPEGSYEVRWRHKYVAVYHTALEAAVAYAQMKKEKEKETVGPEAAGDDAPEAQEEVLVEGSGNSRSRKRPVATNSGSPPQKTARVPLPSPATGSPSASAQYPRLGLIQKVSKIKEKLEIDASCGIRDTIDEANELLLTSDDVNGMKLPAQADKILVLLGIDPATLEPFTVE